MTGITDEMADKAARAHAEHEGYDWTEVSEFWQRRYLAMARIILESALAGRTVVDLPSDRKWIEFCRACRDERDEIVPADFILWGKLLPSEQLGPRCYNHATAYIGVLAMTRIDQWAVFDLRPLNRALTQSTEAAGGVL